MRTVFLVLLTLCVVLCQAQKYQVRNFCNGARIDIRCPSDTFIRIRVAWYVYVHAVWDAKDCEKHFDAPVVCYRKIDHFHPSKHGDIIKQCEGKQQCDHIIADTNFDLRCFNHTSPAEYVQISWSCAKDVTISNPAMFPTTTTQQARYTHHSRSYSPFYTTTTTRQPRTSWNPTRTTYRSQHASDRTTPFSPQSTTYRHSRLTTYHHTYTTTRRRTPVYTSDPMVSYRSTTLRHTTIPYQRTTTRGPRSSTTTNTRRASSTGRTTPRTPWTDNLPASIGTGAGSTTTHLFEGPGLHVRASGDTLKLLIAVPVASCVFVIIVVAAVVCFVYRRKRLAPKSPAPQSSVMYLRDGSRVPGTGTCLDNPNFVLENEVKIGPILVMETDQGRQAYCLTTNAPSAARLAQVHTKVLTVNPDSMGAVGGYMNSGNTEYKNKLKELEDNPTPDLDSLQDAVSDLDLDQDIMQDTEPMATQEFATSNNQN